MGDGRPAPSRPSASCARSTCRRDDRLGASANGNGELVGGVLSTAGGVVILGEDSGALMAADASNGKVLWSFRPASSEGLADDLHV